MTEEKLPFDSRTVLGHPTGLFTLFFAEMWERFSYYGMRALLVFYMIKGFLRYDDAHSYAVYGAYTSLVYMTPFFGGMLADRLLGKRKAVILGGILMALGHFVMGFENSFAFYLALALLICGNGFFKPNISTIVGSLYTPDSPKRDGGFTIFYMGINLGASMSPLLCGYIGETYGWHYGFGLATIGMLVGLAVFVAPTLITQLAILTGAVSAAVGIVVFRPDNLFSLFVNLFVGLSLLAAGITAVFGLTRGNLPDDVGGAPDRERLRRPLLGPLSAEWTIYLATLLSIPVFALLVSGFSLVNNGEQVSIVNDEFVESLAESDSGVVQVLSVVVREASRPAGLILVLAGLVAFGYLGVETFRLERVPRERMFVVLILTFFSMLFWAFFEQAGSSVNNFTDRNVDRVFEDRLVTADEVGATLQIQPTQEQLGYIYRGEPLLIQKSQDAQAPPAGDQKAEEPFRLESGDPFTLTALSKLREANEQNTAFTIAWPVHDEHVGMAIADRVDEIPASVMQSFNPIFILLFGLVFSFLWTKLGQLNLEPSTPLKFSLGLFQLGLGFTIFWYGAVSANERGMVALYWLALGYLLQTTGELCLSPVGLSMVTKLSPARLVSTVMGTWFLATAFSQYLAAIIAQFTGVQHGEGEEAVIPVPSKTVDVYGGVFGQIAIAAMLSAGICFLLVPLLKRWMHEERVKGDKEE